MAGECEMLSTIYCKSLEVIKGQKRLLFPRLAPTGKASIRSTAFGVNAPGMSRVDFGLERNALPQKARSPRRPGTGRLTAGSGYRIDLRGFRVLRVKPNLPPVSE
jgi:hypothetical protein